MKQETERPFEKYPAGGKSLLGKRVLGSCRHHYGLEFFNITGVHTCAYCGLDLTSSYEVWLNTALDHAVPASVCDALGISQDWRDDYSNSVLACSACNSFDNRYKPTFEARTPLSLEEFFALRDRIFAERRSRILNAHYREREFFHKHWLGGVEDKSDE